jgi:CheY-like chemotaxis protein
MGLEVLKASLHDPAKVEETRAMMSRQTRQLIRLVDDLLDVSRITRGRLELRRSKVKLADVIGSAVEASQVFVDEAGSELSVSLPGEPVLLDADPNRLAQIVSNVLINAAKYTPTGGHIRLSAAPEGDHGLILTISDTGIGIPADMLERVFEMFTQVQAADGSPSSGLGIGLTLVQSLVRMHGGAIQAGSAGPNQGSEFRISLPIVIGSADDEAPIPAPRLASRTKRRVLIVDDNQTAAEMLGMVVEMLGNEVRTAHDGRQAIEIAGQFLPEIVFMDLAMPLVDGYEAARQIRKKPWGKSTLLVALTGWGQEEHKRQTKEAGFDHHLVKPGDFADLQRVFAELEGHG